MAVAENQLVECADGNRQQYSIGANEHIYQGTHFFINANGFAVAAYAAGFEYGGLAVEEVDNTGGADGDLLVEGIRGREVRVEGAGFTQALVRKPAHAIDNFVFGPAASGGVRAGVFVRFVSSTQASVMLDH